jgi:hypothetical protein
MYILELFVNYYAKHVVLPNVMEHALNKLYSNTYIHINIHRTYIHTYIIHTYTHINTYIYHTYIHSDTQLHTYTHSYNIIHVHTYIHSHIHRTYIHKRA